MNLPSSTTSFMTSDISYGLFESEGTISSSFSHERFHSSPDLTLSGSASVWSGKYPSISAAMFIASCSSSATKQAIPLRLE